MQYTVVCPRSSDPFYIAIYYFKMVTNSWTYCIYVTKSTERYIFEELPLEGLFMATRQQLQKMTKSHLFKGRDSQARKVFLGTI